MGEQGRSANAITLAVIDPDAGQFVLDLIVLDVFRDGFEIHSLAHLVDRSDHAFAHWVLQNVAHEGTVNLEIINIQIL